MRDLNDLVNGPWIKGHTIPDDRAVDGTFHALRDRAEADVHEIVKESSGLAGTLFRSFMDTDRATTLDAVQPDLELIQTADTTPAFLDALGTLERTGVTGPVTFYVEKDSAGPNALLYLVQAGLHLPDEAYYRLDAHAATLSRYRSHVERMLRFLQTPDPASAAGRIVALEARIAAGHWDVVASRDALRTYNPTSWSDLPAPIQRFLTAAGVPPRDLVVMQPTYIQHLAGLLEETPLDDWKLWATWAILHARAGLLNEEVSEANFDFYGRTLSGATNQRALWKRGVALVESTVGDEIGEAFVEKHFPASSKARMEGLVTELLDAYRSRIAALPWMTAATRARALDKLGTFRSKIGYPDTFRDYSGLHFDPSGTKIVDNYRRAAAWLNDYNVAKIGKPADRDEWVTTPQTVNAFYNPVVNDITFPAAILRPPFFDPAADAAENFGAIGAVIGHEIGHGFDDQGSRYNGTGDLESWWSPDDRDAFTTLTKKLIHQFDGLVPSVLRDAGIDSSGVNGKFTLGENIGDLGGLGIALVAYKNHVAQHGDPGSKPFIVDDGSDALEGKKFTGLQRFFLSWARIWRTAIRPQMAQQYLAIDPHSPAEFRCNIIAANIDDFYDAFDVPKDSPMYIAPGDRVTIW